MPSKATIPITCQHCGVSFLVPPSRTETARYHSRACYFAVANGEGSPNWRGGSRSVTHEGYIMVKTRGGKTRYEHQVVWESAHGPIPRGHEIHHWNLDRGDNRLSNLALLSGSEHRRFHALGGVLDRWANGYDACIDCGSAERKHQGHGLCQRCYMRRRRQLMSE